MHVAGPTGPGLSQAEQRATITAIAGFIPADEAAGISRRVAPVTFQVIAPVSEIEPDDGVPGTVALRLEFITEWRQRLRHRAVRRT